MGEKSKIRFWPCYVWDACLPSQLPITSRQLHKRVWSSLVSWGWSYRFDNIEMRLIPWACTGSSGGRMARGEDLGLDAEAFPCVKEKEGDGEAKQKSLREEVSFS